MVRYTLHDEKGHLIHNHDASKDLSNEIDSIRIIGPFDVNTNGYTELTTMLERSSSKFNEIVVLQMTEESLEFLAFLVLICNKACHLVFFRCEFADGAISCIKAALLRQSNGIEKLRICDQGMTTANVELLCEGVASSPCLENLKLDTLHFHDRHSAGDAVIHALRRNRNLKGLHIDLDSFESDFLPQLLSTALLETKLKSLSAVASDSAVASESEQKLPIAVLKEVLCRSDCELETLKLHGVDVTVENASPEEESKYQNTSVKEYAVYGTSNLGISKTIKLFKSLVKLDLSSNEITSLQFLDPLLVDESSTLQSLSVVDNNIGSVEMVRFIRQLRSAKHLRRLEMSDNSWENSDSGSVEAALKDAMSKNRSLDLVDMECAEIFLALNRGGRRAFEPNPSSESVPTVNLWPEILARASKLNYYCHGDDWGHPTMDDLKTDVIFWLLNRMAPLL